MNIHFSKNIAAMLLCLLYALNGFCGDKPVKPITGTWINLAYQDVRNKYTNPTVSDNTGPELWEQKVQELQRWVWSTSSSWQWRMKVVPTTPPY